MGSYSTDVNFVAALHYRAVFSTGGVVANKDKTARDTCGMLRFVVGKVALLIGCRVRRSAVAVGYGEADRRYSYLLLRYLVGFFDRAGKFIIFVGNRYRYGVVAHPSGIILPCVARLFCRIGVDKAEVVALYGLRKRFGFGKLCLCAACAAVREGACYKVIAIRQDGNDARRNLEAAFPCRERVVVGGKCSCGIHVVGDVVGAHRAFCRAGSVVCGVHHSAGKYVFIFVVFEAAYFVGIAAFGGVFAVLNGRGAHRDRYGKRSLGNFHSYACVVHVAAAVRCQIVVVVRQRGGDGVFPCFYGCVAFVGVACAVVGCATVGYSRLKSAVTVDKPLYACRSRHWLAAVFGVSRQGYGYFRLFGGYNVLARFAVGALEGDIVVVVCACAADGVTACVKSGGFCQADDIIQPVDVSHGILRRGGKFNNGAAVDGGFVLYRNRYAAHGNGKLSVLGLYRVVCAFAHNGSYVVG